MSHITAHTPPMGWNSWDCYGASVTEAEVRGNADYMAAHLKQYGWEYVVVDIQWYEPSADSADYHPFARLESDQYGRLVPAVNTTPAGGGLFASPRSTLTTVAAFSAGGPPLI